jgi:hypothetical protein
MAYGWLENRFRFLHFVMVFGRVCRKGDKMKRIQLVLLQSVKNMAF